MEFSAFSPAELSTMINDAKGTALEALVPAMESELSARQAAEIRAAETEATRALCDQAHALLTAVAASKVVTVARHDGPAYRRSFSALVALVEDGYGLATLKARHVVTALMDRSPETKTVTTVAGAVDYVAKHAKSPIYS